MTPIGILFIGIGYAFLYTGISNVLNNFSGPKLSEALGLPAGISFGPPGAQTVIHTKERVPGSMTRSGSDVTR